MGYTFHISHLAFSGCEYTVFHRAPLRTTYDTKGTLCNVPYATQTARNTNRITYLKERITVDLGCFKGCYALTL